MTNREYLESLSSKELAYFIYTALIPVIGKRYSNSIDGVAQWLDEEANT